MNPELQSLTDLVEDAHIWDARLSEDHVHPSEIAFCRRACR